MTARVDGAGPAVTTHVIVGIDTTTAPPNTVGPTTLGTTTPVRPRMRLAPAYVTPALGYVGFYYWPFPSAPDRTASDFEVICDIGRDTQQSVDPTSLGPYCFGLRDFHTITINDRRGVYASETIRWGANTPEFSAKWPENEQLTISLGANGYLQDAGTSATVTGGFGAWSCDGLRCTSQVPAPPIGQGPPAPFKIIGSFRSEGVEISQEIRGVVVPSASTPTTTTTAAPATDQIAVNAGYSSSVGYVFTSYRIRPSAPGRAVDDFVVMCPERAPRFLDGFACKAAGTSLNTFTVSDARGVLAPVTRQWWSTAITIVTRVAGPPSKGDPGVILIPQASAIRNDPNSTITSTDATCDARSVFVCTRIFEEPSPGPAGVPFNTVDIGYSFVANGVAGRGLVGVQLLHSGTGYPVEPTTTSAPTTTAPPTTMAPTTTIPGAITVTGRYAPIGEKNGPPGSPTYTRYFFDTYIVTASAPGRTTSQLVISCPGAPISFTVPFNPTRLACKSPYGWNTVTVTDSLSVYAPATLRWWSSADGVQPGASTTTTISPSTTVPPTIGGISIDVPASVALGTMFTVSTTGLTPGSYAEVKIGADTLGWALADSSGAAVVSTSWWTAGTFVVSVVEVKANQSRSSPTTKQFSVTGATATTGAPTTSPPTTTTTTVPPSPTIPSSVLFSIGTRGFRSNFGISDWTPWFGNASITNNQLTGTSNFFGAKLIIEQPLGAGGRTLTFSFPVVRLDANRPQPTLYIQAFDQNWKKLSEQIRPCIPYAGDARSNCSNSPLGFALPAGTLRVLVGLASAGPVEIQDPGGGTSTAP